MSIYNLQKSLSKSSITLFSLGGLKTNALLEKEGQQADQSSSEEGPDPSRHIALRYEAPANSYSHRLYLYYKKHESPEALADYLEKHPAMAGVMLKHLLQDNNLVPEIKNNYITALSKKIDLHEIARNTKIPENLRQDLQKMIPEDKNPRQSSGYALAAG